MRFSLFTVLTLFVAVSTEAQWIRQTINTTASFRGLSVVNEKVVWASGTGGTVVKTTDGGKTWRIIRVPEADKLDFRDIEAFDANTAYVLSIGNGESSRIYKTTNGGQTWQLQFKNTDEKAFYDAIACWDSSTCVAMSDPVNGRFVLRALYTHAMGGSNGNPVFNMPPAKEGEAAFAASGTCLITQGKDGLFMVTGGNDARVFYSNNRGRTWVVTETPFVKGTAGSGIFSIAMYDSKNGVIVGGNYEKPDEASRNMAFTRNGGGVWNPGLGLSGYRSGVAYIDSKTIIAVGTNGTDISYDGGETWRKFGSENLNAVAARGKKAIWAVGPNGMVAKMQ